jgi:hypothetical protein
VPARLHHGVKLTSPPRLFGGKRMLAYMLSPSMCLLYITSAAPVPSSYFPSHRSFLKHSLLPFTWFCPLPLIPYPAPVARCCVPSLSTFRTLIYEPTLSLTLPACVRFFPATYFLFTMRRIVRASFFTERAQIRYVAHPLPFAWTISSPGSPRTHARRLPFLRLDSATSASIPLPPRAFLILFSIDPRVVLPPCS